MNTGPETAKFELDREVLLKALQKVQSIVDRKNTIPILSHILIEAADNQFVVSATDLEVGVRLVFEANVFKPGKVAVPAKSLYEIVRELPIDSRVTLKIFSNFWVELTAGKSFFKLVGQDSDEFPQLPQVSTEKALKLSTNQLIRMIDHTVFAVSNDQTRYDLNGVFFELVEGKDNNFIRMVATDGHRLAMMDQEIDFAKGESLSEGVILPRKGLLEIRRVLADSSEVYCCFMENNVIFWNASKQTLLYMRLLEGDFPDYSPVIPRNNDKQVVVSREKLLNSLKRISVLSAEHSRSVKFNFASGKLKLSSSNPKLGEATEDIDIDYKGDTVEIGFNAGYFIDILNSLGEQDNIVVEMTDTLSPSLIKGKKFDGSLNIVMPMQLGNDAAVS